MYALCVVDPYVRIWPTVNGKRLDKKKTSIMTKTLNPVYNESFVFSVPADKIKASRVLLQVMDYDKLSKDDVIGVVELGHKTGQLTSNHWSEMLASKGRPVAHWHKLQEEKD